MALKEQDIVLTTKDAAGNTVIQMPITRVENVEGAVKTINGSGPDADGEVTVNTPTASSTVMGGIKPASAWVKILEATSKSTYSYTATKNCFVCAYNSGGTNNMTVAAAVDGLTIYRDYGHHNDGNNSYPMIYLSKGQTITLTQSSSKLHFSVLDLE